MYSIFWFPGVGEGIISIEVTPQRYHLEKKNIKQEKKIKKNYKLISEGVSNLLRAGSIFEPPDEELELKASNSKLLKPWTWRSSSGMS